MKKIVTITILIIASLHALAQKRLVDYVDPRIGSEGLGRVYIGPTMPFGMIKPSPDCTEKNNSGWAPMPEELYGFSQTHVSGTGGGPKYGNILIMPFCGELNRTFSHEQRESEKIELGYYSTTLASSGIKAELTAADKTAHYRFTFPDGKKKSMLIDAGFFLGESPIPNAREAQQFVGSEIEIISSTEIRGYTRIRGGWNNGRAYTVFFYAQTSIPFSEVRTWKDNVISTSKSQHDSGQKTGALICFASDEQTVQVKIAISFISSLKAQENAMKDICHWNFDLTRQNLTSAWEKELSKIRISDKTDTSLKRMFYTSVYHTLLEPVCRTDENPLWNSNEPYYDDYYAIWDTYRTSSPLITLIAPKRQTDIVRSLINIYEHDGYMPDARSGNCNGRTQGGSNAEILIADAMAKKLPLDYEKALLAMIKDATIPPGGNEEAEGRGALIPYNTLGYIPYGYPRAGTRTIEYSFCDWAIAQVAERLGHTDISDEYRRKANSWKNLWRKDYTHNGTQGFIMPRTTDGEWMDSLAFGHSRIQRPKFCYTPDVSYEGPWYVAWWDCFFYEASSWEYSMSIPHDVNGLIEMAGGANAFFRRLQTFFDHGYYNVANEPSFLTPCLYHWVGRPECSGERVRKIVQENYNDTPTGIPGNDDSGAMSSWLTFHMIGLYPNAGHDYYLIHAPLVGQTTLTLGNGKTFRITAKGLSPKNRYIRAVKINGKEHHLSTINHQTIMEGGEMTMEMTDRPSEWGRQMFCDKRNDVAPNRWTETKKQTKTSDLPYIQKKLQYNFALHGQTRRFKVGITKNADETTFDWEIVRNLRTWHGRYRMSNRAVENARRFCYIQPTDGLDAQISEETFGIISQAAFKEIKDTGQCTWNGVVFRLSGTESKDHRTLLHLTDKTEGAEMWVEDNNSLPIVWKMKNNPVEIDWEVTEIK